MKFDVQTIRKDFPILHQKVNKRPLAYLDNAATTQKPRAVLERLRFFYENHNSNVHRGVHYLSDKATQDFENARESIKNFINAQSTEEIVFTRGATESINLVAFSFGEKFVRQGDEIVVSEMEHHSNFVPWQMLCERKNARLKIIKMLPNGELDLTKLDELLTPRTRLLALTQVSNSLGTINPVKEIVEKAHDARVPVLIDGAQGVQHTPTDVQELDCDFYAFSGHKMYAPTGIGVLYAKKQWLEKIPPYQGGGEMIETVSLEKTTFNHLPFKFEAGTPNFAGAIALQAAAEYIQNIGIQNIARYENQLLEYATEKLQNIEGLTIYGTAPHKSSTISFLLDKIHFYDAGTLLDKMGIAIRTGSHCTMPLMQKLGIKGTLRASFAFYNTHHEIDQLVEGIQKVKEIF